MRTKNRAGGLLPIPFGAGVLHAEPGGIPIISGPLFSIAVGQGLSKQRRCDDPLKFDRRLEHILTMCLRGNGLLAADRRSPSEHVVCSSETAVSVLADCLGSA